MKRCKALFLDRDGVINIDIGYVFIPQDFVFIDGIFELCLAAVKKDYLLIVVTNQAGIGRGYYTEADFHHATKWMREAFAKNGIGISGVYFCPFHPEYGLGKYKLDAACRKPSPGMILQAALEHNINLQNSMLIGDKPSDIEAGKEAGVGRNVLFLPGLNTPNKGATLSRLVDAIPLL
ncbi:D-glycero-alpha-D-manno-heptose-1,7-bisphosphate 7-phosphatase [Desulfarculus baarsii]